MTVKMERTVKLGRKLLLGPAAQHWAIKVGDTWYEVAGASKNDTAAKMEINRCIFSLSFAVQNESNNLCWQKVIQMCKLLNNNSISR